ncbi:hypothetical protein C9374_004617 [Naegleria lovaniensis]|uniref:Uncharacterized protein n=1 Tax=Naegleria lovaniensis TaxID=51637 RepID=A0AA88GSG7_NAELO|nr:uncharacterized protein C9374_004617 [Naegleria lovaniensis]KAG2383280.1 hypothetical protein C9374_004617 [Naegleria lovaniensis]
MFCIEEGNVIPPSGAKYSEEKLNILSSIKANLIKASEGMTRIGYEKGTGTSFYLLPNVICTNSHVVKTSPFIYQNSYLKAKQASFKKLLPAEQKVLFSGTDIPNAVKRKVRSFLHMLRSIIIHSLKGYIST